MAWFFAIAFGAAWALQVAAMHGVAPFACITLAAIMPSVGGLVAARRDGTRLQWRAPLPWIALAFALPSLAVLLAGGHALQAPAILPLIGPPIGEELGWRGWLQPRLRRRWGALPAALAVGIVWALWHLPTATDAHGFLLFSARVIAWSVILAWLAARTHDALPVAFAAHAGLNAGLVTGASERAVTLVCVALAVVAGALLTTGSRAGRRSRP